MAIISVRLIFRETLLATVVVVAAWFPCYASNPDTTAAPGGVSISDTLWTDITEAVVDAGLIFSAPFRFGGREWGITAAALATPGIATLGDEALREAFQQGHTTTKDHLAEAGNFVGTNLPPVLLIGGIYTVGLVFNMPGVRRTGRHAIQALVYSALITTTLKSLIGRDRPFLNNGPYVFHGWSILDRHLSLPSGHSTVAFAICSSLAANIDNPWATAGLYSIATLTALSRVYDDRHWGSDVLLGAVIGTACGYGVVHLHDAPTATGDGGKPTSSIIVIPAPTSITLAWQF